MSKLWRVITLVVLGLIIGTIIAYTVLLLIDSSIYIDQAGNPNPSIASGYENGGFYKIDPETILGSLDQGKANVFTPFSGDPNNTGVSDLPINWTQSNFLKVANALSQVVWHEPLDLKNWNIYDVSFQKVCEKDPSGFDEFEITYYKAVKTGWNMEYTARYIWMRPWEGVVQWGGDETFITSFWKAWHGLGLITFKISPETALQIAEQNGGKKARSKSENQCNISIFMPAENKDMWFVNYHQISPLPDFSIVVDPNSGSYTVRSTPYP